MGGASRKAARSRCRSGRPRRCLTSTFYTGIPDGPHDMQHLASNSRRGRAHVQQVHVCEPDA
eukprot:3944099-Prymnesium_polylepis.1